MEKINLDDITIKYNGEYPNLCSGHLVGVIKGKEYDFGGFALISGGSCGFSDDYTESYVEEGEWIINEDSWPDDFPDEYKDIFVQKVNMEIPWGCCGGCL